MAQTRRKRKRRHRGTQAGTIERSGRTSKPAARSSSSGSKRSTSSSSSKAATRQSAAERRQARFDNPPTWRGALNRAAFAAAILVIFVAVVQKDVVQGVLLGAFAMLIYIPMSYYTDLALYRRRQRRKQGGGR
jgi:Flp pilus assembly protein TadB